MFLFVPLYIKTHPGFEFFSAAKNASYTQRFTVSTLLFIMLYIYIFEFVMIVKGVEKFSIYYALNKYSPLLLLSKDRIKDNKAHMSVT